MTSRIMRANVTPNKYTEIAKANGLADPDKIKVGPQLNIPA